MEDDLFTGISNFQAEQKVKAAQEAAEKLKKRQKLDFDPDTFHTENYRELPKPVLKKKVAKKNSATKKKAEGEKSDPLVEAVEKKYKESLFWVKQPLWGGLPASPSPSTPIQVPNFGSFSQETPKSIPYLGEPPNAQIGDLWNGAYWTAAGWVPEYVVASFTDSLLEKAKDIVYSIGSSLGFSVASDADLKTVVKYFVLNAPSTKFGPLPVASFFGGEQHGQKTHQILPTYSYDVFTQSPLHEKKLTPSIKTYTLHYSLKKYSHSYYDHLEQKSTNLSYYFYLLSNVEVENNHYDAF